MNGSRRLAMFGAILIALSIVSCVPPGAANRRVVVQRDSLTATRDSLRMARDSVAAARTRLLGLDSLASLRRVTPDSFLVAFETTRGRFEMMAYLRWSPVGVDRFYDLVRRGFYDEATVFRVLRGFVAQFGIPADPAVGRPWRTRLIADDPVRESNRRGRVSYASGGPHTRTTQLFINLRDNARLDAPPGYPPIGEVIRGMEVVDSLYGEYGERPSDAQPMIHARGNEFLRAEFPKLDVIRSARVIREW
jgi:peptidyl-prolyl cis-trans isomerase A (cyclophilin A)